MNLRSLIPALPLLRRELAELASRRQTYVVRVIGAVALLSVVFLTLRSSLNLQIAERQSLMAYGRYPPGGVSPTAHGYWYLGIGGRVFSETVPWLFYSIQLLMPALCCGTITMEKERNTLGTLFLTRLSPLTIVLEKLCSRLVPMLTFLLLTFPVLAFVYSLGGVDTLMLLSTLGLLLCECLLYASLGMLCSSWFRTTVSAFMCSYILVALLLLISAAAGPWSPTPFGIWRQMFARVPGSQDLIGAISGMAGLSPGSATVIGALVPIARTIPALLVSAACLGLATVFLTRRAFVTGSSPLLWIFHAVDRFFVWLNDETTGGIVIVRDQNLLPEFDPISWRERSKKSLGKARYLFRILTLLEIPTLAVCTLAATAGGAAGPEPLRYLLVISWLLAALIIIVKASTAISSERARETIEALLSTPMTGAQILQEKVIGMRRLMIVLSVPILTTHVTLLITHLDRLGDRIAYLILAVSSTWLVMQLLAWVSIAAGLGVHSQMKSILSAGVAMLVWAGIARGSGLLIAGPWPSSDQTTRNILVNLLSPQGLLVLTDEFLSAGDRQRFGGMGGIVSMDISPAAVAAMAVGTLVGQAVLLLAIRSVVLRIAPRLLGRADESPVAIVPAAGFLNNGEVAA